MIGSLVIGKSFRGVLNYCLEDKLELTHDQKLEMSKAEGLQHLHRAEVLEYNMCYGTRKELIEQFNDVRKLRPQLSKPVMHIALSFDPADRVDKDQLRQIGKDFASEFGFEKNQYVTIAHHDTRHQHLHIVANRIGFDGQRISDSQSYQKVSKICRSLEQKHALKQVLSPRLFQSEKDRLLPRLDQRKEQLKEFIRETLLHAKHFEEFKERMKRYRVEVIKGRGIAFRDDKKVYVKGSYIGYSLSTIEKILAYSLEQRQQLHQRIELTKQQEAIREKMSDEQKLKEVLRSFLKGSTGWSDRNISITQDKSAKRIQEELLKPELQQQINKELLQENTFRHRKRKQHSLG